MFLDVRFDGQEILVDELGGLLVLVGLGIQPSAGASGGSRTEVEQNAAVLLFSCKERLIDIFAPIYGHNSPPRVIIKAKTLYEKPPLLDERPRRSAKPAHLRGAGLIVRPSVLTGKKYEGVSKHVAPASHLLLTKFANSRRNG
jgi:hypothetical protein